LINTDDDTNTNVEAIPTVETDANIVANSDLEANAHD
jgi:hypothetical protein